MAPRTPPNAMPDDMTVADDGHPLDPEDVIPASEMGAPLEDDGADGIEGGVDGPERMTPEEYEAGISAAIEAAENYIDTEVSPDRELLAKYYACDPSIQPGEVGRSAVISPEVRNTVLGHMPGLMRKFAGPERWVEFQSNPGTPSEQAELQTEFVFHVMMNDSPGYLHIQAMIDDALRRRTGICTWWWEDKEEVTRDEFSGLDENAFALLQMEAQEKSSNDENIVYDVQITDQVPDETQQGGTLVPPMFSDMQPGDQSALMAAGQAPQQTFLYSGYVNRRVIKGRARWRAVPPEEFIITPTTSAELEAYALVGTRETKTISELVALGHDEAEIRDAVDGGAGDTLTSVDLNVERLQRDDGVAQERIFDTGFAAIDPSSEKIKYCVVYAMIDRDGDGIAERRKICTVGDNNRIIYDEIYEDDMVPFGLICPYPEPHAPFGMAAADLVMDVQEVKTELVRGTLDSLAESITTRLAFWQGKVNVDDILNTQRGAAIRTSDIPSNVLQNLAAPFQGAQTMPLIQYIDEERNKRTGTNPASPTGFDPDSTQSTAREAIGSLIDASQERTEYIARNFAETGFRRLAKGLRNLTIRHQDHRRIIRLNGTDVSIDPRSWDADLDCRVTDAGRTGATKTQQNLITVLTMQKDVYGTYGPNNRMVTLTNISNTVAAYLRSLGFSDPTRFMTPITPEIEAEIQKAAAAKAAEPTPEKMLAMVQQQKNNFEFQAKMAATKMQMDRAVMQDDQKRDQAEMNFARDTAKILGDYGIKLDEAAVRRAMAENDAATAAISATEQPQAENQGGQQ